MTIRAKTHTLEAYAKDSDAIKETARRLARLLLAEHPVALRRAGVANFVEDQGQRTLGEFENGTKKR